MQRELDPEVQASWLTLEANVTMTLDDALLKKARKIAVEKDTTLTGLIREYLEALVEREERFKLMAAEELESLLRSSTAVMGHRDRPRDDLHARR